jgi:hypothetical protein
MELKNVNPNDDIIVANHLNNINLFIFENYKNQLKKKTSYVIFSKRCHDFPKNKIPHIVHVTNEH